MRIDAHHHFWQLGRFEYGFLSPDQTPLWRDFLPGDLAPLLRAAKIDRSVLVQTISSVEETRWFLELAEQNSFLAGVVGWVDLTDPAVGATLDDLRRSAKLVGIRHNVHDEPDLAWLERSDVRRGLSALAARDVPYDLLVRPHHLEQCLRLARELPDLRVVIDHLAKPRIAARGWDDWAPGIAELARHDRVFCKLSGMITEAAWNCWRPGDLRPYVEQAVECFGPARLMFGSDWPVCLLAGGYAETIAALEEIVSALSETERSAIMGSAAATFYGLDSALAEHSMASPP